MQHLADFFPRFFIPCTVIALSYLLLRGEGIDCYLFQIVSLAGALIFSLNTKRFFWFIVLPLYACISLYFPIGYNFGAVTKGYISALIATDLAETGDFISSIPFWHYSTPIFLIIGISLLKLYTDKRNINFISPVSILIYGVILVFSSIVFILSCVDTARVLQGASSKIMPFWKIFVFITISGITLSFAIQRKLVKSLPIIFTLTALTCAYTAKDFHLLKKGIPYFFETIEENRQMQTLVRKNDWVIQSSHPQFKNFLIVIGESVRRDYMHAYGYPVENTNFMNTTPGIIFEGFTSEGDGTIESLRRVLTFSRPSGNSVNYSLNLIGLAQKAGFSTAWFSNQGFATDCDTPISAIALLSEHKRWLEQSFTSKKSDEELLPLLQTEVNRADPRPKLIILHLHGSHPSVCSSISPSIYEHKMRDGYYREPFCYVESIRKTDQLLQSAYNILQSSKKSFSMLYFADHGLSHNEIGGQLTLKHSNPSRPHRDIPLFCTSSTDTSKSYIRGKQFGDHFLEGAMNWLGITTKQIPNPKSLFTEEHDKDIHNYQKVWTSRRDDPPINTLVH